MLTVASFNLSLGKQTKKTDWFLKHLLNVDSRGSCQKLSRYSLQFLVHLHAKQLPWHGHSYQKQRAPGLAPKWREIMCRWLKVPFIPSGFSFLPAIKFQPEASRVHPWCFLMPAGSSLQPRNVPEVNSPEAPALKKQEGSAQYMLINHLPTPTHHLLTNSHQPWGNKAHLAGNKEGEYWGKKIKWSSIEGVQALMASGTR